jgi:pimeloyl-ACP methyl ester carboxylesterase
MFLDVNGVRLHVLVFGDGPRTLVAVGGWTGSWEVWEEPIAQLTAGGWRCVAYDHRGSGESPVDPALITVEAMVDDVAGVLDALGVERCILAGESQGGAIAQYAAARSPQRFDGLVLSAPTRTGRNEGSSAFADACRADYPAAVDQFVSACFPEPDSNHVKRWGRNILLRAEPEQAARIIEMWRDEAVPDSNRHPDTDPPRDGRCDRPDRGQPSTRGAASERRTARVRGQRPRPDDDAAGRGRRGDPAPLPVIGTSPSGR